ncbi:hypothetical protein MAR_037326 [Mya arenaria]|uniref:Uncharacterized protein n=1 Tax=Mya arenaria TaxID=6604 RepID=A0ABY7FPV6_MYAAR|nr:hypothetical protein MAR_037326 [Mya arenaria]
MGTSSPSCSTGISCSASRGTVAMTISQTTIKRVTQPIVAMSECGRTVRNPKYRECHKWLANQFTEYEFTNDARFECFKDYPRNQRLFQQHKDFTRDYERKAKFYRSHQRLYCVEINRQIRKVEDRFSKLIHETFSSNQFKSRALQYSYNKWRSSHEIRFEHVNENSGAPPKEKETAVANDDPDEEEDLIVTERPDTGERRSPVRQQSLRSVSVDNLTRPVPSPLKVNPDVTGLENN